MKSELIKLQTALCAFLLTSSGLYGNFFKADIETGASRSFSYTLYQIGVKGAFPISELKFPAAVNVGYANVKGTFIDRITVNARFSYNFNHNSGTMIDSDWDQYRNPIAQSHSKAILNTFHSVDVDIAYRVATVRFLSLHAGVGFMYQYFNYDIENLVQWDTVSIPGNLTIIARAGLVLTYNIKYYMPYISISPCFNILDRIFIYIKLAISPYPVGIDRDNHLLRAKLATGKAHGIAIIAALDLDYHVIDSVFVSMECTVNQVWAWGKQKQMRYATTPEGPPGPIATIENRLVSTQVYVSLGAGISINF
jgi:outer membrane protease